MFFADRIMRDNYFGVQFKDGKIYSRCLKSLRNIEQNNDNLKKSLEELPVSETVRRSLDQSCGLLEKAQVQGFSTMDSVILVMTAQRLTDHEKKVKRQKIAGSRQIFPDCSPGLNQKWL